MSAAGFREAWARHYPDLEPVGYEMLAPGARQWVRFHSLPGSRRYPETDADWRTLLARQNRLAAEVLGEGRPCWLVQSRWEQDPDYPDIALLRDSDPFAAISDYGLSPAIITLRDAGTEFENRWEACAGSVTWATGRFDALLCQIADDRAAPTLWFSGETGAVFAPYDGGVDLFLPDPERVRDVTERHRDWLSGHPSGL